MNLLNIIFRKLKISVKFTAKGKNAEYYDESFRNSKTYKNHYSESKYLPIWKNIIDRLRMIKNPIILEIGCGSGQFACLLRDNGMLNYLGIDFSPKRIEFAQKKCPEFNFVCDNALTTSHLRDDYYDTVISLEFLEHINEDIEFIKRIKPGTKCYFSVPDFYSKAHVRCFGSKKDIYNRYSEYFENLKIEIFAIGKKQENLLNRMH